MKRLISVVESCLSLNSSKFGSKNLSQLAIQLYKIPLANFQSRVTFCRVSLTSFFATFLTKVLSLSDGTKFKQPYSQIHSRLTKRLLAVFLCQNTASVNLSNGLVLLEIDSTRNTFSLQINLRNLKKNFELQFFLPFSALLLADKI